MKGEWEAAVQLIMEPREGEKEQATEARRLFLEEGDLSAAAKLMPPFAVAEKAVLKVRDAADGHVGFRD